MEDKEWSVIRYLMSTEPHYLAIAVGSEKKCWQKIHQLIKTKLPTEVQTDPDNPHRHFSIDIDRVDRTITFHTY